MITLKNVKVSKGQRNFLRGVSLHIPPGACLCIVGESGSGKTTLLRLLLGEDTPTSGSIEVDGVDILQIPAPILQLFRQKVGIIFQEPILLSHATVEENIALPLALTNTSKTLIERNTQDLMKRLQLTQRAKAYTEELSRSERSLVGIARALITAPAVIFADEPFSDLNPEQVATAMGLIMNMHKNGSTVIVFTRDLSLAEKLHARRADLKNGVVTMHKEEAVPAKTLTEEQTHHILEAKSVLPMETQRALPGRRIRITSIGSNAQAL